MFEVGDHLKVSRGVYTHHGVYVGSGRVAHYTGELAQKEDARVCIDALASFASGGSVSAVRYKRRLPTKEIVSRAESRVGERRYCIVRNNCEHFARWCVLGKERSEQVDDVVAVVAGTTGTAAVTGAALGTISAAGSVAGLSGPGIMSGLAAVGGTVGAGAVGGVVALATAPAAAGVLMGRAIFPDDAALEDSEREARRAARTASVLGGAAGAAGTVGAISAMGSVAGLSGAGIASGLAAMGGVVGGGMAAGAAVAIAAPAAAAVGVAYGAYRAWRWLCE